jgi:hypothetical protein
MNRRKSHPKDKIWRLVLVGNHGSIVALGSLKTVLFGLITALILTIAGVSVLGLLYLHLKLSYSHLAQEFDQKDEKIRSLRDERDVLMARLVITESKLKSDADSKKSPSKQISLKTKVVDSEADVEPQLETKNASIQNTALKEPEPFSVAISDFKIVHDSKKNTITASYTLKNTTKGDERLSGRCVVVLKGSINSETTSFLIPNVPWEGDTPSKKDGRPFAIRNFMTVNLDRDAPDQEFSFDQAIVFVFDFAGAILLKREIPINLSYEEVIASRQTDPSLKNSKDFDAMADIKNDIQAKRESQNQADPQKSKE